MKNRRNKITKSQRAIFSHIPQNKRRQNVAAQLKPDLHQSIAQSFRLENANLFFSVIFERRLPKFQAAHQVFEVAEF